LLIGLLFGDWFLPLIVSELEHPGRLVSMKIAFVGMIGVMLQGTSCIIFNAFKEFKKTAIVSISDAGLKFAILGVIVLTQGTLTVDGLYVIMVAAPLGVGVLSIVHHLRRLRARSIAWDQSPEGVTVKPFGSFVREIFGFGKIVIIMIVFSTLYENIIRLYAVNIPSDQTFNEFAVAQTLVTAFVYFSTAISTIAITEVNELKSREDFKAYTRYIFRLVAPVVGVLMTGIVIVAKYLVYWLFPVQYPGAVPFVILYSIPFIFQILIYPITNMVFALDRVKYSAFAMGIALAIYAGIAPAVFGLWGITGLIIAFAVVDLGIKGGLIPALIYRRIKRMDE
jgi:O-antigen/teichoic acid export membrane protein